VVSFGKKITYLVVLTIAVHLSAQEKVDTPLRMTQEAAEKSSQGPKASGKSIQDPGEGAKTKLEGAVSEGGMVGGAEPHLSPRSRRDPFRPFTLNVRPSVRRRENLSPLERFELGQLKLVAVIWDIKEAKALVEDSAGLGYVIKVGTPIGVNDGKVKTIKPNGVTIEEFFVDFYGAKKKRDVEMRLSVEKAE